MRVVLISLAIYMSSRCEIFYHLASDRISLISWLIRSASGKDLFKTLVCAWYCSECLVIAVVEILTITLFRIILLQANSLLAFKVMSWWRLTGSCFHVCFRGWNCRKHPAMLLKLTEWMKSLKWPLNIRSTQGFCLPIPILDTSWLPVLLFLCGCILMPGMCYLE